MFVIIVGYYVIMLLDLIKGFFSVCSDYFCRCCFVFFRGGFEVSYGMCDMLDLEVVYLLSISQCVVLVCCDGVDVVYFDGFVIEVEVIFFISEEFFDFGMLIILELDYFVYFGVIDDGVIVSEFFFDNFKNFFVVEFVWNILNGGQSFMFIMFCDNVSICFVVGEFICGWQFKVRIM